MQGNLHVRFGEGDEETCPGNGVKRFIPTPPFRVEPELFPAVPGTPGPASAGVIGSRPSAPRVGLGSTSRPGGGHACFHWARRFTRQNGDLRCRPRRRSTVAREGSK